MSATRPVGPSSAVSFPTLGVGVPIMARWGLSPRVWGNEGLVRRPLKQNLGPLARCQNLLAIVSRSVLRTLADGALVTEQARFLMARLERLYKPETNLGISAQPLVFPVPSWR